MNDPRPANSSARPPEIRSMVANCWYSRTGSSVDSTDTAVDNAIREVWPAAAASTAPGLDTA